jgi:hypothetical protein
MLRAPDWTKERREAQARGSKRSHELRRKLAAPGSWMSVPVGMKTALYDELAEIAIYSGVSIQEVVRRLLVHGVNRSVHAREHGKFQLPLAPDEAIEEQRLNPVRQAKRRAAAR